MINEYLLAFIVGVVLFFLFIAILGAIVFKFSREIDRAKAKEKYWYDKAEKLQHIIDGYGMRNLKIGGDE